MKEDDMISFCKDCHTEQRFIEYGEVTDMVQDFLFLFKEIGSNPDDAVMDFYFRDELGYNLRKFKQILYEEDGEYRLWDYNCAICEKFLLMVDSVHALEFHNELGAYRMVCGNCRKKIELNYRL